MLLPKIRTLGSRAGVRLCCSVAVLLFALGVPALAQVGGMGGYGGPSILNRGGERPGTRGGSPIDFTYYGAILGNYTTGVAPVAIDPSGRAVNAELYGGSVEFGASGSHAWGRSQVALDYRGDYRRYNQKNFLNGSDQFLTLSYATELNRRWAFSSAVNAGTSTRAVGGFLAPSFTSNDLIGLPLNDLLDNRVYVLQGSGMAAYRLGRRSQLLFSGDAFYAERSNKRLIGVQGFRAGLSVEQEVARRTQVSVGYNYMQFRFPRAFGSTDIHNVNAGFRRQISRSVAVMVQGGAFRMETLGTQQVAFSPEVAAILGRQSGIAALYRIDYAPQVNVSVTYMYSNKGTCSLNFQTGVTPGNGLYLTSKTQTENAGCSYQVRRKLAFSASAGHTSYASAFADIGGYSSYQGGGGINYLIAPKLNFTVQADMRTYSITSGTSRFGSSVSMGLALTPSDVPIPRW